MPFLRVSVACAAILLGQIAFAAGLQLTQINGGHSILDAHNCYPYKGSWNDRITRALSAGYPVGIEQDLAWFVDPQTRAGRVVVSHSNQPEGSEPTLQAYFFDRVRPMIEEQLKSGDRSHWPLLVLHFDFKDNQLPLLRAVWELLGQYEAQGWLTTAEKTSDPHQLSPLDVKPILVLTEEHESQEQVFYQELPIGSRLRLFGSARTAPVPGKTQTERNHNLVSIPPATLFPDKPTNYRRWWNGSWYAVEEGGAPRAGNWDAADETRLRSLVQYAHSQGYWIRFYTLDGFSAADDQGWGRAYNFGSPEAAHLRWSAAMAAGVDLIATDQYEAFREFTRQK